jgi:alpha-D-ribose 1-methylphosphonate 5-triphosphate synthase subunit PhnH
MSNFGDPVVQNMDQHVIETQRIFRNLLDGMARPGKLQSLPLYSELEMKWPILAVARTLLDHEVRFSAKQVGEWREWVELMTMSVAVEIEEADYVFWDARQASSFDGELKLGTELDPELGATLILLVDQIADTQLDNLQGVSLTLSGPGVRDVRRVYVTGLNKHLISLWQSQQSLYPLGTDWMLVDMSGTMIGLPRSTQIEWQVQS